jgi:hypothetical protein
MAPSRRGLAQVLCVAFLVAGVLLTVGKAIAKAGGDGIESRAQITWNQSFFHDGTEMSLLDPFRPGESKRTEVDQICHGEIEPEAPRADSSGTITEGVANLRVDGQQICILSGEKVDIDNVRVGVHRVTDTFGKDGEFKQVTLSASTPPTVFGYLWDDAAPWVLGIGGGLLLPAIQEGWQVRRGRPRSPEPSANRGKHSGDGASPASPARTPVADTQPGRSAGDADLGNLPDHHRTNDQRQLHGMTNAASTPGIADRAQGWTAAKSGDSGIGSRILRMLRRRS